MAALEKTYTEISVDLASLNAGETINVLPYNEVAYQVLDSPGGGTAAFTAGRITLERSIDGSNFVAMASAVVLSGAGIQTTLDVSDIHSIRFRTSTAGSGEGRVRIALLLIKELN